MSSLMLNWLVQYDLFLIRKKEKKNLNCLLFKMIERILIKLIWFWWSNLTNFARSIEISVNLLGLFSCSDLKISLYYVWGCVYIMLAWAYFFVSLRWYNYSVLGLLISKWSRYFCNKIYYFSKPQFFLNLYCCYCS